MRGYLTYRRGGKAYPCIDLKRDVVQINVPNRACGAEEKVETVAELKSATKLEHVYLSANSHYCHVMIALAGRVRSIEHRILISLSQIVAINQDWQLSSKHLACFA